MGRFDDLCPFCLELHRGACAHPECPIRCTVAADQAVAPAPAAAPTPTQPSIVGGGARRTSGAPPPASRQHVATSPSIVQPMHPEEDE